MAQEPPAQRSFPASDAGRQVLIKVKQQRWLLTPHDCRLEAVCRAMALLHTHNYDVAKGETHGYNMICHDGTQLAPLGVATAQRLISAIATVPPPASGAGDFLARRARQAPVRACNAAAVLFWCAYRSEECETTPFGDLLPAFCTAAAGAYSRSVAVALDDGAPDDDRRAAFLLALKAAGALSAFLGRFTPASGARHPGCVALTTHDGGSILERMVAALVAGVSQSFARQLPRLHDATLELVGTMIPHLDDFSPIDASLVTAIASFASDSAAGVFALEALLWLVEGVKEGSSQGWVASKRLGDAAVPALCAPAVVDAMVHHLSLGYGSACATIIEVLSEVTPDARAFATPRVVGALLEVISLDGAAAFEAYALRKNEGYPYITYERTNANHAGFEDNPERSLGVDEVCLQALLALVDRGYLSLALAATAVVPLVQKLRASLVDPTPGPGLYELRTTCLRILRFIASGRAGFDEVQYVPREPARALAILDAGGVDVIVDCLKQVKLPGSNATPRLTYCAAAYPCRCLGALIDGGATRVKAAVRRALDALASHAEYENLPGYSDGSYRWCEAVRASQPVLPNVWVGLPD